MPSAPEDLAARPSCEEVPSCVKQPGASTLLVSLHSLSLAFALPSLPLPEGLRSRLPSIPIRLGLDLKGGISLTLGVDVDEALATSLAMTGQRLLRDAVVQAFRRHGADRMSFAFRLAKAADRPALEALYAKSYLSLALRFGEGDADGGLPVFATLTEAEAKRLKDDACDQALAVIRSRIDAFGVAEPTSESRPAGAFSCICLAYPIPGGPWSSSATRQGSSSARHARTATPKALCLRKACASCLCADARPASTSATPPACS